MCFRIICSVSHGACHCDDVGDFAGAGRHVAAFVGSFFRRRSSDCCQSIRKNQNSKPNFVFALYDAGAVRNMVAQPLRGASCGYIGPFLDYDDIYDIYDGVFRACISGWKSQIYQFLSIIQVCAYRTQNRAGPLAPGV